MTDIKAYDNLIKDYHLPSVDEIPDLELYMDQVIIYVKKYFNIFPYESEHNFITPSMINNYVKSGLIPAPVGKKYSKRHIAYIFVVFFLKQVFSLEEVRAFIHREVKAAGEKKAYEQFRQMLEDGFKTFLGQKSAPSSLSAPSPALHHATLSIAHKLYAQALGKMKNNI